MKRIRKDIRRNENRSGILKPRNYLDDMTELFTLNIAKYFSVPTYQVQSGTFGLKQHGCSQKEIKIQRIKYSVIIYMSLHEGCLIFLPGITFYLVSTISVYLPFRRKPGDEVIKVPMVFS